MLKIFYDVLIADSFETRYFPLPFPVPVGNQIYFAGLEINFEPKSGDNMKDADAALDEYIKKNYPDKEYKIYYWTWATGNVYK